MDKLLQRCYMCAGEGEIQYDESNRLVIRHSCRCGEYLINVHDKITRFSNDHDGIEDRDEKLSALIMEQTIKRLPPFFLQWPKPPDKYPLIDNCTPVDVPDLIRSRWPKDVPEMIDRTLCNMAVLSSKAGQRLTMSLSEAFLIFARSYEERQFILDSLKEHNYVTKKQGDHSGMFVCILTPKGWRRYSEITHDARRSADSAFVAMWFGDKTHKQELDGLFSQSIKPAIREAGYKENRADIEQHNDFIMDKIIADIRQARFVIADFTGNRGGVYFEAGFARGEGIPVIHTCKNTDFKKTHFDIQQINTLKWAKPSDLYEKLLQRIRGTVGEGPGVRDGYAGERGIWYNDERP